MKFKNNKYVIFIYTYLIILLLSYIGGLLQDHFYPNEVELLSGRSWGLKFFAACILAPLYETLLFQHLIIKSLRVIRSKIHLSNTLIITISGLIFGLIHLKNLILISFGIVVGAVFAYTYIHVDKKTDLNPFWSVFLLHAAINFTSLCLSDLPH